MVRRSKFPGPLSACVRRKAALFHEALGDLCSRVIHQGTRRSARSRTRASCRGTHGRIRSDHRGDGGRGAQGDPRWPGNPLSRRSDPVDGEAIRKLVRDHLDLFAGFLRSNDAETRIAALEVLTAFPDLPAHTRRTIEDFYILETDASVRRQELQGLSRATLQPDFIAGALRTEPDSFNQFLLRRARIVSSPDTADDAAVSELIHGFTACGRQGAKPSRRWRGGVPQHARHARQGA